MSNKPYSNYDDEKKEKTSLKHCNSNDKKNKKERKFYVTKETITALNNDKSLLKKLTENFQSIKAELSFENNMIVIHQVDLDKERVLNMIQEVIGIAYSEAEFNRLVEELASIEHSRKELLADPAATFSNYLAVTEKGALFTKHNENGSPRNQWFCIKNDRLYWRDKEKWSNHINRSIEMKSIVKIRPGKTTKTFKKKKANKVNEDCCFSIICVRKTLDLQCKTRLMRDEWFTYIEFTHRHYVRAKRKTMYLQDLYNPLDDDLDEIGSGSSIGFAIGGGKDINTFRECIKQNIIPSMDSITFNGLFYDYYFNTMSYRKYDNEEKKENNNNDIDGDEGDEGDDGSMLFYPSYCCAKIKSLNNEKDLYEYYITIGLNSNIKQDEFKRKNLNLVIVIDKSGSMNSKLDDGNNKMKVANNAVIALLNHLTDKDRVGVIQFDNNVEIKQKLLGNIKMDELKESIENITAGGGTNFEIGYKTAIDLFRLLPKNDNFENRIIFLTDACPNNGICNGESLLSMISKYSEQCILKCGYIYSTFIGVGLDFNTSLIEQISACRGCNYFSVKSTKDFMSTMDDEFDYMVTPLVFNICLKIICEGNSCKIDKVYGPKNSLKNGEITKIHTLFPSKKSKKSGKSKGGLQLIKLQNKYNKNINAKIEVTFKDRNDKKYKNIQNIIFKEMESKIKCNDMIQDLDDDNSTFYDNLGIRKAILLCKYVELIKDWIKNDNNKQSVRSKLMVSSKYLKLFAKFLIHFEKEMKICNDETLKQEMDILIKLSTSSNI